MPVASEAPCQGVFLVPVIHSLVGSRVILSADFGPAVSVRLMPCRYLYHPAADLFLFLTMSFGVEVTNADELHLTKRRMAECKMARLLRKTPSWPFLKKVKHSPII